MKKVALVLIAAFIMAFPLRAPLHAEEAGLTATQKTQGQVAKKAKKTKKVKKAHPKTAGEAAKVKAPGQ